MLNLFRKGGSLKSHLQFFLSSIVTVPVQRAGNYVTQYLKQEQHILPQPQPGIPRKVYLKSLKESLATKYDWRVGRRLICHNCKTTNLALTLLVRGGGIMCPHFFQWSGDPKFLDFS